MVLDCLLMSKSSSEQKKIWVLYSIKLLFFPYNRWEGLVYLSWFVNQLVVISIILCTAFIQKEKKIFCVAFVRKKLWHFWNRRENITSVLYNGSINAMFVVNKSLDCVNYNTSWIKNNLWQILQTNGLDCFILAALKIQNPEYQNPRIPDPEFQNPEFQNFRIQPIQTI